MSGLVLYGFDLSPPVRACLLTLNALELPFAYKHVDLFAGEHLTEQFLEHNPQHTVPVLDDNGTWLWDSHAICSYLVGKYSKTDHLYPKDLVQRAVVDQRLYFDASVLFNTLLQIVLPYYFKQQTVVPKEIADKVRETYEFVEKFLENKQYLCGDTLTIADFSILTTLSSLNAVIEIEQQQFPRIIAWMTHMQQLPYYEKSNGKGLQNYVQTVLSKLTVQD